MKDLWPKFALATWNDYQADVQQDFFDFDKLKFGVKAAMDKPNSDNPNQKPIIAAMQDGANHRSFDLMKTAASGAGARIAAILAAELGLAKA